MNSNKTGLNETDLNETIDHTKALEKVSDVAKQVHYEDEQARFSIKKRLQKFQGSTIMIILSIATGIGGFVALLLEAAETFVDKLKISEKTLKQAKAITTLSIMTCLLIAWAVLYVQSKKQHNQVLKEVIEYAPPGTLLSGTSYEEEPNSNILSSVNYKN